MSPRYTGSVQALLLAALAAASACAESYPKYYDRLGTVAGAPVAGTSFVSSPVSAARLPDGSLYVLDGARPFIVSYDAATSSLVRVAGRPDKASPPTSGLPASGNTFQSPAKIAADAAGGLWFTDAGGPAVGRINTTTSILTLHAASSRLYKPVGLALAANGSVYVADVISSGGSGIHRFDPDMTSYAKVGGGPTYGGLCPDGVRATECSLPSVERLAVDPLTQNVFFSFGYYQTYRIQYIEAATGLVRTYAGSGGGSTTAVSGDGGPAKDAVLYKPGALAFNAAGDLYVIDSEHAVRKITRSTGIITTVAGRGPSGGSNPGFAEGGAAALFSSPSDLAYDPIDDSILVADTGNSRLRRLKAGQTSSILAPASTVQEGVFANAATFQRVASPVATADALYFSDLYGHVYKMRFADRMLKHVAGSGLAGTPSEGQLATEAGFTLNLRAIAVSRVTGDVFISHTDTGDIWGVRAATGRLYKVAGLGRRVSYLNGDGAAPFADGIPASQAGFYSVSAMLVSPVNDSHLYIADDSNDNVRRVDLSTGIVTNAAGHPSNSGDAGDGGLAVNARLWTPRGIALDPAAGTLYIAEYTRCVLRAVLANGTITTAMGQPFMCTRSGDPTKSHTLHFPSSVALATGPDGTTRAFAGTAGQDSNDIDFYTGLPGVTFAGHMVGTYFSDVAAGAGDLGSVTNAQFDGITGLATDPAGNLYIADANNGRIRVVLAGSSTAPACPAGYSCGYGQPEPCEYGSFCPANSLEPQSVAEGYWSFNASRQVSTDGRFHVAQEACPRGQYCTANRKTPCPPGTVGLTPARWKAEQCSRCPVGSYQPERGASSLAACLPCPPGFTSYAAGSAFCTGAQPGSVAVGAAARALATAGGSFAACPNGTYALPGMSACTPLSTAAVITVTASGVTVDIPAPAEEPLATPAQLTLLQVVIAVPIAGAGLIPALLAVLRYLKSAKPGAPVASGAVKLDAPPPSGLLVALDLFSVKHALQDYESLTKRRTPLGGACSILALAVIAALASSLVVQFAAGNVSVTRSLVPATPPALLDGYPLAAAKFGKGQAPAFSTAALPALTSSLQIRMRAMGRQCASVAGLTPAGIIKGGFNVSSTFDPTSFASDHLFMCTDCMLGPQSSLSLKLDASCQALTFTVGTVGVEREVTLASFSVSPSVTVPLDALALADSTHTPVPAIQVVDATFEVGLQRAEDFTTSPASEYRGYSLKPQGVKMTLGDELPTVTVNLNLPLSASLMNVKRINVMTVSQLISGLLGLFSLLGGIGILFTQVEKFGPVLKAKCGVKRGGKQPFTSAAPPAAAVQVPNALAVALGSSVTEVKRTQM